MAMSEEAKALKREYNRQWRKRNTDHVKEYQKQWRAENRDKEALYSQRYWEKKSQEMRYENAF